MMYPLLLIVEILLPAQNLDRANTRYLKNIGDVGGFLLSRVSAATIYVRRFVLAGLFFFL